MSFNPVRYEFINAIRVGNQVLNSATTEEYTIHEEPDFVTVVHKVTMSAAKIPWTNVSYMWGKWYEPVTQLKKKAPLTPVPSGSKD